MTGVGNSSVYKLLRESKTSGHVEPPKKKPGGSKETSRIIVEENQYAIRTKVHSFYFKKEIPTLDKVLPEYRRDDSIPLMSRNILWKTLKRIDFAWEKHNRKTLLTGKR